MPISLQFGSGFPELIGAALGEASKVALNSYNAYSGQVVGAVAVTDDGLRFPGCFMENASYGMTICAEPAAIMAANTGGRRDIRAIAISGGDPQDPSGGDPCTPCGRCRQILWEVAVQNKREVEVYCANLALTNILLATTSELLPLPWGPKW